MILVSSKFPLTSGTPNTPPPALPASPQPYRSVKIIQVFNRYLHLGGEEKSVRRIYLDLESTYQMDRCFFDSREWTGPRAPGKLSQVRRLFHNPDSSRRFEKGLSDSGAEVALFHNIYPVGSPALYDVACRRSIPVIQYVHNFRPFSVGGTLYANGRLLADGLKGNFAREILHGAWQGSRVKSLLFAMMLKRLHRSGKLRSVKAWIAISDFMRGKMMEAGIPADRVHTLRHAWDAMSEPPPGEDLPVYLFLGRLVEDKGIKVLLEAWTELYRQLGDRTPVLQIAGTGPLESLVREKSLAMPCIRMSGMLQGVEKFEALRTCRAVMVPSTWWEPLGLVVYEAYDFGKPVLAARSGGLGETVQHGLTGFHHQPGSASGLAQDVMTMEAMSPERRLSMGAAGRDWLLRGTNSGVWRKGFAAILQQIPR